MMKEGRSAAFVTNGFLPSETYRNLFKIIKENDYCHLCCIGYGQNYIDAFPTTKRKEKRKEELLLLGANEVFFLPSQLDMLDEGSLAFSLAETLSKRWEEDRIDALILPIDGDVSMLNRLFLFLASLPKDYIKENQTRSFEEKNGLGHRVNLLERYLPGSKEFLSKEQNVISFRFYQAARSIYCPAKLLPVQFPLRPFENKVIQEEDDESLYAELKTKISSFGEKAIDKLNDIYLGSENRSKALLASLEKEKGKFSDLAHKIEKEFVSTLEARRYLLRVIADYRKIDETVSCLKGFVED